MITSASLYLANKFRRHEEAWSPKVALSSGYKETDLRQCARAICLCLKEIGKNDKLNAIKKKFAAPKFMGVSKMPELGSK